MKKKVFFSFLSAYYHVLKDIYTRFTAQKRSLPRSLLSILYKKYNILFIFIFLYLPNAYTECPGTSLTIINNNGKINDTICKGSSSVLTAPEGFSNYIWSNGETTRSIRVIPDTTTLYSLEATYSDTCIATDSITVMVKPVANIEEYIYSDDGATYRIRFDSGIDTLGPFNVGENITIRQRENNQICLPDCILNLGPDISICHNDSVVLDAGEGVDYRWSNGMTTRSVPVSPDTSTTYSLTVANSTGCVVTDDIKVNVKPVANIEEIIYSDGLLKYWIKFDMGIDTLGPFNVGEEINITSAENNMVCVPDSIPKHCPDIPGPGISDTLFEYCADTSISINASPVKGYTVDWYNSTARVLLLEGDTSFTPLSPGTYYTRTRKGYCISNSLTPITVNEITLPGVDLKEAITICEGKSEDIHVNGNDEFIYKWSTGESGKAITVKPDEPTVYTVTATDTTTGCSATDSVDVSIQYRGCLNIPSAFTPNGDGKNDTWCIEGINNSLYINHTVVKIYDRWGTLLYYQKGFYKPWDGTYKGNVLPVDSYFYVIDIDVENENPVTGHVTIIK